MRRALSGGAAAIAVVAALAVGASGCGYPGATRAAKVRSWASANSLVGNNATIADDVRRARLAVTKNDALALRTICAGTASDVGTAYDTLPTPDPVLTDTLNRAYEQLAHAAGLCSQSSSVSSVTTREAMAQFDRGLEILRSAQRRARSLGVHWPGTF